MKYVTHLFIGLSVIFLLAGCISKRNYQMQLTVRDQQTKEPVPGARVSILQVVGSGTLYGTVDGGIRAVRMRGITDTHGQLLIDNTYRQHAVREISITDVAGYRNQSFSVKYLGKDKGLHIKEDPTRYIGNKVGKPIRPSTTDQTLRTVEVRATEILTANYDDGLDDT